MKRITSLAFLLPLVAVPVAFSVACTVTTTDDSPDGSVIDDTPDSSVVDTTDAADGSLVASFVTSNFTPSAIDMTNVQDITVAGTSGGCTIDTDSPTTSFTCTGQATPFVVTTATVTQTAPAPSIVVIGVNSLTVNAGVTLTVTGSHPLVIFSKTTVEINGTIDVSATNSTPGAGSLATGGTGQPLAAAASTLLGSAGGTFCGLGGQGAPVGTGATFGTTPTAAYGTATLIPLQGGSAGGAASTTGFGGGAIQITALTSITITGTIAANGNGGTEGNTSIGGGGGGSGGGILLEAPTVTGTGKLFANGGGGASTTTAGSEGEEDVTAAAGGSPSGGTGNSATVVNGIAGSQVSGATEDNGGGGGGAGYIRINTTSGTSSFTGISSPTIGSTTCGTQGALTATH